MQEKIEKIRELDDQIYTLCFSQPRYIDEIAKKMYGKKWKTHTPTLAGKTGKIQKLSQKGWLTEMPKYKPKTKDKRSKKRKYYQSTAQPILEILTEILSLTPTEQQEIHTAIDTPAFRSTMEWEHNIKSLEKIILSLSIFALWITMFERYMKKSYPQTSRTKRERIQQLQKGMTKKEFQHSLNITKDAMEKFIPNYNDEISKKDQNNIENVVIAIYKLNDDLLKKLATLTDHDQIIRYLIGSAFATVELTHKYPIRW